MHLFVKSLLLAAALAAISCGQSKEDAAVARILNRKPAGSVRLVNLTKDPVQLWIDGVSASGDVEPQKATSYVAKGNGKHELKAMSGTTPLATRSVEVTGKGDETVFLVDSGSSKELLSVIGEPRRADDNAVQVVAVLVSKSKDTAQVEVEGKSVGGSVGPLQPVILEGIQAGSPTFTVKVGSQTATASSNLELACAYSLVISTSDKGLVATVYRNTGTKPAITGAAGGG